eukprot:592435-Pleurochrysis_carterae.AAC.4
MAMAMAMAKAKAMAMAKKEMHAHSAHSLRDASSCRTLHLQRAHRFQRLANLGSFHRVHPFECGLCAQRDRRICAVPQQRLRIFGTLRGLGQGARANRSWCRRGSPTRQRSCRRASETRATARRWR